MIKINTIIAVLFCVLFYFIISYLILITQHFHIFLNKNVEEKKIPQHFPKYFIKKMSFKKSLLLIVLLQISYIIAENYDG